MFEVTYETTFSATHRLTRNGRAIEPLHGHDWRVEAAARGRELNATGIVVDFEALRDAVASVTAALQHQELGPATGLGELSPSAEAVARHIYVEVRRTLGAQGAGLARVRVWEAPGCSAAYWEE